MVTRTMAVSGPAVQPSMAALVTASTPDADPCAYCRTSWQARVHAPGPILATPVLRSAATSMSPAAARAACSAMSAARSRAFMATPPSTISAVSTTTAMAKITVNTATEPCWRRRLGTPVPEPRPPPAASIPGPGR